MPRTVHVIQGLSAAGCFTQALHPKPGELLVNEDVLSCGPLRPFHSLEQWAELREAYWDSISRCEQDTSFNRDMLEDTRTLRDAETIVLWLGVGAAEQLLLAWFVHLLKLIGSSAQLHVAQFTQIDKRGTSAWALGLLSPEHFKEHPPAELLSSQAIVELERYWEAVTAPDPAGLLSVLSKESADLPHFAASLQCLLRRFPNHQTGLGRWESELLRNTQENGPIAVRVIGHTLGRNFGADLVGDHYLFSRLRRLGGTDLAHPLINISGDPGSMRTCQVVLTDDGQKVLGGHANAVELNGIDDWILGVHLNSERGQVWYHKHDTLVAG